MSAASIRLNVLASGSNGNSILVRSEDVTVLVDCGIGMRKLSRRLAAIGSSLDSIQAVLVTHTHGDHFAGVPGLVNKLNIPVYCGIECAPEMGGIDSGIRVMATGEAWSLSGLEFTVFEVPHDVPCYGFRFCRGAEVAAVATDLGYLPQSVRDIFAGCDTIVTEANHDTDMLQAGPYASAVKRRIAGAGGHLDNETICEFIEHDLTARTSRIILTHRSQACNDPDLIKAVIGQALRKRRLAVELEVF